MLKNPTKLVLPNMVQSFNNNNSIFQNALAVKIPETPNLEETVMAIKIRDYNASIGTLEGPHCDICNDKGCVMGIDDNGFEKITECSCMTKRNNLLRAKRSGMGELLKKSLDNYIVTDEWQNKAVAKARNYMERATDHWYAMTGQSGSGKTHICAAIANHFIAQGKKVIYMPWNLTVKELKLKAKDDYISILRQYVDTDVLYIDDFFKGKITDADITIAFELINSRAISPHMITILSSELSLEDIREIDEAISGRIKEKCGPYAIHINPDPSRNYRFKVDTEL